MNSNVPSNREKEIFEQALDLGSGPERQAFVQRACEADEVLCARVLALLAAHETDTEFLAEAPAGGTVVMPVTEQAGDRIGRYKLREKIGEGGCGLVYVAEQEEPVRRRVALKLIKLGMDTREVVARFEAERQALAMMDHPNIAKVFDAGATETGRPYFVMELVRGIRITDYCDQNQLSTEERLGLFVQVCHAIQHAHQKGIIHRDIKPSNVLVTLHDGVAVPKVIDFGIAKAMEQRLTDKTIYTAFEQFIGTPAYTSPEQAEMSGLDIDTRSDVYALGVLLYELLTGQTPFDGKELAAAGLEQMRRTIREKEPLRPSTRLRTMMNGDLATTAAHRRIEAPKLIHLLRGDLDWIVMKCLEKDRTRRYETANGLAQDIVRHLNSEPVNARPPSTAYRVGKFVRRNKVMVAAASAVAAALVLGIIASTWQAVRATRAEGEQSRLRSQAQASEQKALASEKREVDLRKQAQAQAYASDMKLAQEALARDDIVRAQQLLNQHRPQAGEADPRGWEWRYLWGQSRSDALFILCQLSNEVYSIAVSADARWLAVGELYTGGLSIWDLQTRQKVATIETGDSLLQAAFSPREPLLAFSTGNSAPSTNRANGVRLWNAAVREIVADLPLQGPCAGLAFSADGLTLVSCARAADADGRGQMTLWQVPEGRKLADHTLPSRSITASTSHPFAVAPDLHVAAFGIASRGRANDMVCLMDLATGTELWTRECLDMGFAAFAFPPDGKLLATGSSNARSGVQLLDRSSGKELGLLDRHRSSVTALVFWPDGRTLASAGGDGTIRLWDLSTLQQLAVFRGHRGAIKSMALLSDKVMLVSGGEDGSVRFWDTAKARTQGSSLRTLAGVGVEFSLTSDSRAVVAPNPSACVSHWQGPDFQDRQPLIELGTNLAGVCLSRDGRLAATGSTNGIIEVWDLQQQKRLHQLAATTGAVKVLGFLGNGTSLVALHLNERPVTNPSGVGFAEWSKLAIHHPEAVAVYEWDLRLGRTTRVWQGRWPAEAFSMAQSRDERWLLALGLNGSGWLANRVTGVETYIQLETAGACDLAFSWDGNFFSAPSWGGAWTGFTRVWETSTLREAARLPGGGLSATFSPDGKRLAVGSAGDNAVTLWDLENQRDLLTLAGEGSNFWRTEFSPDGNLLASINMKGVLHLWRAPPWAEIEAAEKGSEGKAQ